jgi:hypothetical protein
MEGIVIGLGAGGLADSSRLKVVEAEAEPAGERCDHVRAKNLPVAAQPVLTDSGVESAPLHGLTGQDTFKCAVAQPAQETERKPSPVVHSPSDANHGLRRTSHR